MVSREEFEKYCEQLDTSKEIEKYNCCSKKITKRISISAIIIAVLVIVFTFFWKYSIFVGFAVFCFSSIIIVINNEYKWIEFKRLYSDKIFDFLLKDYKHKYRQDNYLNERIFKESKFEQNFNRYTGEDLLTVNIPNDDGTPSGICLHICDLTVEMEKTEIVTTKDQNGIESQTEKTTIQQMFKGVFAYIQFPFEFKCGLNINCNPYDYENIKLEDISFNKTFSIYTNDQLEALLILTPSMMNKLKKLSSLIKNFKLNLTKSGKMYFSGDGNLFKLTNTSSKPTGKTFLKYFDDIAIILSIVDEIKTNNKIFKM